MSGHVARLERAPAIAAEALAWRILRTAFWTGIDEGGAAIPAESLSGWVVALTPRTPHR